MNRGSSFPCFLLCCPHPPWLHRPVCPPLPPALPVVLLCCRPCLGSLISWCQPVQWAWDATLQPLMEASFTSSLPWLPEPDLEGWLVSAVALGLRGQCSLKGLMGGQPGSDWMAALGLQGAICFYPGAECSCDIGCSHLRVFCWSGVLPPLASSPQPFLCFITVCSLVGRLFT